LPFNNYQRISGRFSCPLSPLSPAFTPFLPSSSSFLHSFSILVQVGSLRKCSCRLIIHVLACNFPNEKGVAEMRGWCRGGGGGGAAVVVVVA